MAPPTPNISQNVQYVGATRTNPVNLYTATSSTHCIVAGLLDANPGVAGNQTYVVKDGKDAVTAIDLFTLDPDGNTVMPVGGSNGSSAVLYGDVFIAGELAIGNISFDDLIVNGFTLLKGQAFLNGKDTLVEDNQMRLLARASSGVAGSSHISPWLTAEPSQDANTFLITAPMDLDATLFTNVGPAIVKVEGVNAPWNRLYTVVAGPGETSVGGYTPASGQVLVSDQGEATPVIGDVEDGVMWVSVVDTAVPASSGLVVEAHTAGLADASATLAYKNDVPTNTGGAVGVGFTLPQIQATAAFSGPLLYNTATVDVKAETDLTLASITADVTITNEAATSFINTDPGTDDNGVALANLNIMTVVKGDQSLGACTSTTGGPATYTVGYSGGFDGITIGTYIFNDTNGETDPYAVTAVSGDLTTFDVDISTFGQTIPVTADTWRIQGRGAVGINTTTPNGQYAVDVSGGIRAFGMVQTSDRRAKQNVKDLDDENMFRAVVAARTVSYNWNDELQAERGSKDEVGFLAQDMLAIKALNFAVHKTGQPEGPVEGNNYMGIEYASLMPAAFAAIKHMAGMMEKMQARIEELERQV